MTREKAVKVLKENYANHVTYDTDSEWGDDLAKAVKLAIEALEQEPCEDCVSREEVLKVFSYNHDYCDDYEKAFLKSIGDTRKLPTVQPTRIHAKWIGIEYDGYADGNPVYEVWECSHCGCEHCGDYDTLTAYCPNCGAKMESEG